MYKAKHKDYNKWSYFQFARGAFKFKKIIGKAGEPILTVIITARRKVKS